MLAISFSMYAPEGGEGLIVEPGERQVESGTIPPAKEGWVAWAKRKGQETLNKITPSTDVEPYPGDWDYKSPEPKSTEPLKSVGLGEVKTIAAKDLVTAKTAKSLGFTAEPQLEPTPEPTKDNPNDSVINIPAEPAKSSAWQRLTTWFGDIGVGAKDFDIDLGDIEDDVMDDLNFEGITADDLAKIGKDTKLTEGVKLTEESLAKIQTIDRLLKSWTLAPFKKTFSFAFPIDAFADLVSELATTKTIPVDIGVRLEAIIKDIPLMPKIIKTVITTVGISVASSRTAAITYIANAIPALEGLAKVMPDVVKVQEIIENSSGKPKEILEKIIEAKIESLEKVPLKETLKVVDNLNQAPEKALEKSKRINRIVTNVALVLFALAIGVLALCIADWGKENRQFHKIVEIVGPLILVGLTGGIFYGSIRASRGLSKFDRPAKEPTVVSAGEPVGI